MRKRADRPVAVPASVGPGTVLSDRFRLVRPIGSGGMAVVWRAEHLTLGIPVALKMLRPVDMHSSVARARFLQEARVVAAIKHPNVVHILEYGMHGDLPYLAMELLEGEPLSARIQREGRLDAKTTVWIVEQVARPIDKAHTKNIVHRDIKPDNIFLESTGEGDVIKLVDFGIAKLLDPDVAGDTITRTGAIIGTTHYLSPERARGKKPIDGRADLWALAVVVYECLVGRRPFDDHADDLLELLKAIAKADYPPPSTMGAVSTELDAWVDQALNPNPDMRFPTAMDMARALREALLPGTVPSDTGTTMDAGEDESWGDLDDEETYHFEPVRAVSQLMAAVEPLARPLETSGHAPLPSMDDVPDLPFFSDVDEQVVSAANPLGAQLRRFDLSLEPHSVAVDSSPEPAPYALIEEPPPAPYSPIEEPPSVPVPDLFAGQPADETRSGSHAPPPVDVEPSAATADVPGPSRPAVTALARAPHRDWRLLAMAAAALVVASVLGVTMVRLFSRPAPHPTTSMQATAAAPPATSAAATVAAPPLTPATTASEPPPANSVASPVWDVERLPVQDPPALSPRGPVGPPPQPRTPAQPGTKRKPHEVFGL